MEILDSLDLQIIEEDSIMHMMEDLEALMEVSEAEEAEVVEAGEAVEVKIWDSEAGVEDVEDLEAKVDVITNFDNYSCFRNFCLRLIHVNDYGWSLINF